MALIENRGQVMEKRKLMELVWPDTAVEENNLAQSIGAIRKALGEQPGPQRYVLTIPGQGYSFVAEVSEGGDPETGRRRRRFGLVLSACISAAILLAGALLWSLSTRSARQYRMLPLTGSNGEFGAMSFSPDGGRVAYAWRPENGRASGIYVKVIGAGNPVPLATGRGEREPEWSPDGRYIAYYREPPGLYLIPSSGGAERKISDTNDMAFLGRRMAWFPDGKRLAIAEINPETGFRSIFELSIDTGKRRKLTSGLSVFGDYYPAISPDGQTLAFIRHPSSIGATVYLVRADGGEPRQVSQSPASSCDWTRDGREIVYSTTTTVSARCGELRPLAGRRVEYLRPDTTLSILR